MSKLLTGFQHRYPQSFLDELARSTGTKWVKPSLKTIPKELVQVSPLGPPSGIVYYIDFKYKSKDNNINE